VVEAFTRRGHDPADDFEMSERREIVLEMLKQLPEHQRAALLLREQEEMSYREIAGVLGVSEGKVKVDVFRARNSLRERWARAQKTLAAGAAGEASLNGLPKLVL
jgi:RNA polymerase sigma-70 factor (ECF subfamily)